MSETGARDPVRSAESPSAARVPLAIIALTPRRRAQPPTSTTTGGPPARHGPLRHPSAPHARVRIRGAGADASELATADDRQRRLRTKRRLEVVDRVATNDDDVRREALEERARLR